MECSCYVLAWSRAGVKPGMGRSHGFLPASTGPPNPFGGVRVTTGTPPTARFPGQWFQSESGLHQNWMRDYDPTTGRYMRADPLGLVDGGSVYGYARQNPGRYVDPTGEFPWGLAFGAANLVYQLYINDWRFECVNWLDVGMWTLTGGAVGAFQKGAFAFKGGSNTWGATTS